MEQEGDEARGSISVDEKRGKRDIVKERIDERELRVIREIYI